MKYLLPMIACVLALTACQKPGQPGGELDSKALAERFIKPAGSEAVGGVVFNAKGDVIAVTADGKLAEPCRLPALEGDAAKPTTDAAQLAECHGATGTSIYNISQISAVRHKGSSCIIIVSAFAGYATAPRQVCWEP